ncbi:PepSY domain-containing protein [Micromonospora sp. NPDC004540]|uniref:PepSY domain-containing protein n=1 Tax=Micromonospora sp. NPDC004540 TaxID=3154457 RepID=UPI0033A03C7D
MRRTSLVLAAMGGAAVLAVAGVAVGVTAADRSAPGTAPAAVTVDDLATTVGGCGDDTGTADDSPGPDDSATAGRPGGAPSAAGPSSGGVDRQRAGKVALARLGGGRIVEIEAETEHGRPVWSVKVARAGGTYEVKVDRGDGAVVEVERRADGDRRADDGRGTDDRYDDHGGDRGGDRGDDDRYDDHGGDDRYDDHGGDRSGGDD